MIREGTGIPGWPQESRYGLEVVKAGNRFELAGPVKRERLSGGGLELLMAFTAFSPSGSSEKPVIKQTWDARLRTLSARQTAGDASDDEISGAFSVVFLSGSKAILNLEGRKVPLRKQ